MKKTSLLLASVVVAVLVLATGYLPPPSSASAEEWVSFVGTYDITWDMEFSGDRAYSSGPIPYTHCWLCPKGGYTAKSSTDHHEGRWSGSGVFRVTDSNSTYPMSTSNVHAYELSQYDVTETGTPGEGGCEETGPPYTSIAIDSSYVTTEPDKYNRTVTFAPGEEARLFNFNPMLQADGTYALEDVINDRRTAPVRYLYNNVTSYCLGDVETDHTDNTYQEPLMDPVMINHADLTSTDKTGTKFVLDKTFVNECINPFYCGDNYMKYNGHIRITITRREDKPTASFTAEPTETDRTVNLDASGSKPAPGGSITQYEWDFGDGSLEATPSSTISHQFPESDRDYTVKLVVVSEKGVRSDPYTLKVRSPGVPKVEIGKISTPADSTPRPIAMYSTLEVKSVKNLGCGVKPTSNTPSCNFEWLESNGQQDADYVTVDDGSAPPFEYALWTKDWPIDAWHRFKVRATNPVTGKSVESAPVEVDDVIPQLPYIMRQNGWPTGADLLDHWLSQGAKTKPTGADFCTPPADVASPPDPNPVTMDGFVLRYDRYEEVYNRIVNDPKSWLNDKAKGELYKVLSRHGLLSPTSGGGSFDLITGRSGFEACKDSIQGVPYNQNVAPPWDDGFISLGNFSFRINVAGTVEPCKKDCGNAKAYDVTINQVGVFVRDSFDFNEEQPLGCWSPYNNFVWPYPVEDMGNRACLFNSSFRNWRDHWGDKGGDYMIYSDVKRAPLAKPEKFKILTK
jgi:hypothetical protein